MRIFGILMILFSVYGVKAFADCVTCGKLSSEITDLSAQQKRTEDLLAANKDAIAKIPPTAASQKIKLSSNILILVARTETLLNQAEAKKVEKVTLKCDQCQN